MDLRALSAILAFPLLASGLGCSSGANGPGVGDEDNDTDDDDGDTDGGNDEDDDSDDSGSTDSGSESDDRIDDGTDDVADLDSDGGLDSDELGDTGDTGTGDTGSDSDSGGDTGTDDSGSDDSGSDEPVCGDNATEGTEECDGTDFAGKTCQTEGFVDGALACTDQCTLDTAGCTSCGNDAIDGSEECDGTDLGANQTCADVMLGSEDELLTCTSNCTYDFSACSGCGDGVLNPPEQCEPGPPADLDGQSCESLGHDGGALTCTAGCSFDVTACHTCGDGAIGGPEECDGDNFGEATCANFGFTSGDLVCQDCVVDSSDCHTCGDDMVNGPEECDGTDLDGATCQNQGFDGGTISCNGSCVIDTSGCYRCGDGDKNGSEECDGSDLDGASCTGFGYTGGSLSCTGSCVINKDACVIASSLNTINYDNHTYNGSTIYPLDHLEDEPGYVRIMVPSDVTSMSLSFTPRVQSGATNNDRFTVTLRDGGTVVDSCSSSALGGVCNLGTVDTVGHAGKVLVAEIIDDYSTAVVLRGFEVQISAATDGLSSPLTASNTWPNDADAADYVLWPVGPATGSFSYTWTENSSGQYSIGVMNPTGTDVSQFDVTSPNTGAWPSSGSPAGWYMMATSTAYSTTVGRTWNLTVTP